MELMGLQDHQGEDEDLAVLSFCRRCQNDKMPKCQVRKRVRFQVGLPTEVG